MAQAQMDRPGVLPRVVAVAFLIILSGTRASAQAPSFGEDRPWRAPGAFGLDPLTGEKGTPLSTDPEDTLSQWKTFQQTPLPTEEGAIIFHKPTAALRGNTQIAAEVPVWKQWLLPGGLALTGVVALAGCLLAWRMLAVRRAARIAEVASRYLPMQKGASQSNRSGIKYR